MEPVRLKLALRRLLKVMHTLAGAGFVGGLAALAAVALLAPVAAGTSGYAPLTASLARIAAWVVAPSMIATVVTGLLAMAANPAFYDLGWVWAKAATGILVLEGGLHVVGPMQDEARRAAASLVGGSDPAAVARLMTSEVNTAAALVAVSAVNVVLGVWRPRFMAD